jgi:hypothetical protein
MMVMWLAVVMMVSVVSCEYSSLPDTVRTLQAQVSALLDRRQEDFTLLQRSVAGNSEVTALREELGALR